jgi:hypothetical protein
MRLIQLYHPGYGRRIAKVNGSRLALIDPHIPTLYDLFTKIIEEGYLPGDYISDVTTEDQLDYDDIYEGADSWKILPSFDHPKDPMMCILSGTGLTHKTSAENRQKMYEQTSGNDDITDSMKIYLWGEKGGKPEDGKIGIQPEWFYKGNGTVLRGLNEPLEVPPYADGGGEEPEIAGVYIISSDGIPYRIGFTMANEFSDHIMEEKNYLYLASSKLRDCAIGPELILENGFNDVNGKVSINREERELWSKAIKSGEEHTTHSLKNLEYHHFKYRQHCIPGTIHIHFLGTDAFSFGDNIQLQDGDCMHISFDGFGKPLINPLSIKNEKEEFKTVHTWD